MTRYITFRGDDGPRLGLLQGDDVVDVHEATGGTLPRTLLSLMEAGAEALKAAADLADTGLPASPMADLHILAPLVPTKNLFAVGRNYLAHVEEGAAVRGEAPDLPPVPVFFTKPPTAVIGPDQPVPWQPDLTTQLDWEAELAVVIGRGGRDISADDALDHIFGYTAANDISARDLQFSHGQWFKGKALDGSCPLGPFVVTADEVPDPQQLDVQCRVNGVVKQSASTSQMIFPISLIIEWLSAGITLEPGDIILTGTPEGVGFARKPPEFLQPGDVVEVEITGLGILRNRIGER